MTSHSSQIMTTQSTQIFWNITVEQIATALGSETDHFIEAALCKCYSTGDAMKCLANGASTMTQSQQSPDPDHSLHYAFIRS